MPLFSARGPISHQTWDQRTEDYLALNPAWKFMFMGWDVQGFLQNLPLPHSSSCWFPCSFSSMPGRVRNQLPGLSCKHSRQAAAQFFIWFFWKVLWFAEISIASSTAFLLLPGRVGNCCICTLEKADEKMAMCAFHSAFSLRLFEDLLSPCSMEYSFLKGNFAIAK